MVSVYSFTYLAAIVFLAGNYVVRAQYLQDYEVQNFGGLQFLFYRQTATHVAQQVVLLEPLSLFLVYNCYYMKDICKNAENFALTTRGQNLHPNSGIANNVFGYDLNGNGRGTLRGRHSCPDTPSRNPRAWILNHPCPEGDQRTVMRHDGPWWTTALEPGTTVNKIADQHHVNGAITPSNIRYSCDEFPPKSFIEGGDGVDTLSPSNTRCAAIRCSVGTQVPPVKAEQDWQGLSHGSLRIRMLEIINADPVKYGWVDQTNSVILFRLLLTNVTDGVAARVYTYDNTNPALTVLTGDRQTTQAKRQAERSGNSSIESFQRPHPSIEELQEAVKAGYGSESLIHADKEPEEWPNMPDPNPGMPEMKAMAPKFRWDLEDETNEYNENLVFEREVEEQPAPKAQPLLKSVFDFTITPILKRASSEDLVRAKTIVKTALAKSTKLNALRLAKPIRNKYGAKAAVASTSATPLLLITPQIAEAAALVAEANAVAGTGNVTKRAAASSGTYWMGSIQRKGTVPWGDDAEYKVFRNVLDFGAIGDGVTDDTAAITLAMTSGKRCGEKCNGSTTKNAIVYFPPGNYLISTTIPMPFGTQVIGDANERPRLIASPSFLGLGVLSTDEYTGGDGGAEQYYINTANFYRQIRNIIIDITQAGDDIACLHYQVAQATTLQNLELIANSGTNQVGIFAENGSGGGISDVVFTGGGVGIYGGEQQFTAQRLTFNGCTIGVHVIWDWGWVWKGITMTNVGVGLKLVSEDGTGNIGSISVLDSSFTNVGTVVLIAPVSEVPGSGSTGVVLENVALSGVAAAVADTAGATLLDGSSAIIGQWTLGPIYEGSTTSRSFSHGGKVGNYHRKSTLIDANGAYFERAKPQYESNAIGDFIHIKDLGVTGDGTTDDTFAFQRALFLTVGKILFIDAGSYILTSTITIPPGARIVGETWSQLVASGSYFEDASKPKVMIRVGNAGDVGIVEMQDLMFTSRGATAGLILIEWNIEAASPGSAGLWDCHVRVGGATGTQLTPAECPPVTSGIDQGCSAASLMMHITKSGSGYFENMWLWVADHMLDDPDLDSPSNEMVQTTIYVARGFLIESTKPTWLYNTASEHAVFYQYNFHQASNIFAGMLQTESPYYQPPPPPPAPFESVVGLFPGDPVYSCATASDFSGCDESWSVIITKSENIFIACAGLYSWFSTYAQTCIDTQTCQKALVLLNENKASVRIQNFITIGAKYMAVMDGSGILALDNLNVEGHPRWSQISILDVGSTGAQFNDLIWIDPKVWEMEQPQFTCIAPCNVKLPPWTGATSTVNYPLLTVSAGTWTSTITQAPLTVSIWVLEVVTITEGSSNKNAKRQDFEPFFPVFATTPYWPSVVYTGIDGSTTMTAPTIPFPTPPSTIDAPPKGAWPKRAAWLPIKGQIDFPIVSECEYPGDILCNQPWLVGANETSSNPDLPGDYDENFEEYLTVCPAPSSTSSTSTTITTTTQEEQPTESPLEEGNPVDNKVDCYEGGQKTENVRMVAAANSFCNRISDDDLLPEYIHTQEFPFPYNGGFGTVTIKISLEIKPKCKFTYNLATCLKYLSIPTDSCDCAGINNKHGGIVDNPCYTWRIDPQLSA